MKILIVFLFAIVVTNTDLSTSDLFINQIDLMRKIRQQLSQQIFKHLIKITKYSKANYSKKQKVQRIIKKLLKSKSTFVSPFVDYSPIQFTQGLQKDNLIEVQNIPINFQNLRALDKFAQQQDAILIVIFSKISSNVQVLEEITETSEPSDYIIAVELANENVLSIYAYILYKLFFTKEQLNLQVQEIIYVKYVISK